MTEDEKQVVERPVLSYPATDDKMFETSFTDYVRELVDQDNIDVYCFRLYDFWDEDHYREDTYWHAHSVHRPFFGSLPREFRLGNTGR